MTTPSPVRSRRIAAAATILTVIAVAVGALLLALSMSVPDAWWPHTGRAFATDAHAAHHDPCGVIVGRAKVYCERGATHCASTGHRSAAAAAFRLVSVGAGLAALVVWRRRKSAGQRRH
ncbi:hypothetical protein ACIBJF_36520 [Streptomyces sp. NPDC050743]|uniref:hypothetical protein n=1 Tax=Streptomyces sp. NPDC050743 TaxID=3365634 RepID=UPI00379C76B6